MNAWKHGERSAEAVEQRAMLVNLLRLLRDKGEARRESARWIDVAGKI